MSDEPSNGSESESGHSSKKLTAIVASPLHEHPLKRTLKPKGFGCEGRHQNGGCRSGGDGKSFASSFSWHCKDCNFDLCVSCAAEDISVPSTLQTSVHTHPLVKRTTPSSSYTCMSDSLGSCCRSGSVCGESRKGYSWYCKDCNFDFCPHCAISEAGLADWWPSPLLSAIGSGASPEIISKLVETYGIVSDEDGTTPLMLAIQIKAADTVVAILLDNLLLVQNKVVGINAANVSGATAIHCASSFGRLDCIKAVFQAGADIIIPNTWGRSPVLQACRNGHVEILKFLHNAGADINKASNDGTTPFSFACLHGHLDCVKYLKDAGSDTAKPDSNGWTPLISACSKGHLAVARYLHEELHADIHVANTAGSTAFYLACSNGHIEVTKWLHKLEADINKADNSNWTPFNVACLNGHLDCVKYLKDAGSDTAKPDSNGWTPLISACSKGHLAVARYLYEELHADIHVSNNAGSTAFYWACSNGHIEIVHWLHKLGADINKADSNPGWTPFNVACLNGHLEVVRYLKDAGADIARPTSYGSTPFISVCEKGHLAVARYLGKKDGEACRRQGRV